jgi:hypothetical protein
MLSRRHYLRDLREPLRFDLFLAFFTLRLSLFFLRLEPPFLAAKGFSALRLFHMLFGLLAAGGRGAGGAAAAGGIGGVGTGEEGADILTYSHIIFRRTA